MTTFAPRAAQPVALADVTPAVEAKVRAWQDARRTRQAMWEHYLAERDAHSARQAIADGAGRKIRRSQKYAAAEARYAAAEHRADRAEAEIEMELRIANPGVGNPSIMATKRELTRSAG